METGNTMTEMAVGVVKSAPPAVVSGLSLFGVSLQDWTYVVTLIYTSILIGQLALRFWRKKVR